MLRDNFIVKYLYVFAAILSIVANIMVHKVITLDYVNDYVVSYQPNTTGISVYQPSNKNSMKCNFTTVNRIVSNMLEDSFYIQSDYSNDYVTDIILTNDEDIYRIIYNRRTRDYLCVSNPFAKNYVPATYIDERGGE